MRCRRGEPTFVGTAKVLPEILSGLDRVASDKARATVFLGHWWVCPRKSKQDLHLHLGVEAHRASRIQPLLRPKGHLSAALIDEISLDGPFAPSVTRTIVGPRSG